MPDILAPPKKVGLIDRLSGLITWEWDKWTESVFRCFGYPPNYTSFERDGTMVFNGDATVWNDINVGINPRNTGVGRPTLAAFATGNQEFQFAVNDFVVLNPAELLHGWREGSEIEFHIHWATGGANDATPRGVKWQVSYTYATKEGVFPTAVTASAETAIAANEVALKHRYTSVFSITPSTAHIGTQVSLLVTRIASAAAAPAANPFALSMGIHYEIDTAGSRTRTSK